MVIILKIQIIKSKKPLDYLSQINSTLQQKLIKIMIFVTKQL